MEYYVKTLKALKIYDGPQFMEGNSIIIKYLDLEDKKTHVKRGTIISVGTAYLYLRITKEFWNHKQNSCWWICKKIKIKNILTIKHFKNVLD